MPIGKRKQSDEPRKNFTVRLSELEYEQLQMDSSKNGMKPSAYVRELILHGGTIDTTFAEDRRNLINEISRVGNNINQIVRIANSSKLVSTLMIEKILNCMKEIQNQLLEVTKRWR